MKTQGKKCIHNWQWDYDCFSAAVIKSKHSIGIPVRCSKCGKKGFQHYIKSFLTQIEH